MHFHTVKPVKVVDVLDLTYFNVDNASTVKIGVPCGAFRFMDIEIKESFQ